jgi:hypothetical protein
MHTILQYRYDMSADVRFIIDHYSIPYKSALFFMRGIIFFFLCCATFCHAIILKSAPCNGQNDTCSPNWCTRVTNNACVDPLATQTIDNIPVIPCKVCAQSNASKCTSSFLSSTIRGRFLPNRTFRLFSFVLLYSHRNRCAGSILLT